MKSSILSPLADVVFRQNCRDVVHAFGPTLRRAFCWWMMHRAKTNDVLRFKKQVKPYTRRNDVVTYHARRVALFGLTCQRVFHHIVRSEEHTSELQSLRHLVCRLLLEKKK